ncbi:hypothetical protein RDWZM_001764 [Blomia tropicalis]|uniref:Uncharacterized protein n=1 Tax=Blomia tropicalis TaxID=40697 RepID=A0A9Q0MD15_BLOTA|nr:hypothetical protein RDWZM_001764 [Blomia tropicalis]
MYHAIERFCIEWNNQTLYPSGTNASCHLVAGIYPSEIYWLNKTISTSESKSNSTSTTSTSRSFICSPHNEINNLILRYLHCSISFAISPDNFGGHFKNGSWTGMLSLFASKKADFVPHVLNCLGDRTQIIYYQTLMPNKDILSILSYSYTITLNYYQTISLTIKSNMIRLMMNYFTFFGLLVGQASVHLMETKRSIIYINPFILWIFFAWFLRAIFSNDITAALLSREKVRIDYFSQLYQNPNARLVVHEKSSTYYALMEKYPHLKRQLEPTDFNNILTIETFEKMIKGTHVVLTPRDYGENFKTYYTTYNFYMSKEGHFSSLITFPIRLGVERTLRKRLAKLLKNIYSFGLLRKIDKTIDFSQVMWTKQHNQSIYRALDSVLIKLSKFKYADNEAKLHNSRQFISSILYLYLIGIENLEFYLSMSNSLYRLT